MTLRAAYRLILAAALLGIAACAATWQSVTVAERNYSADGFALQLPLGWVKAAPRGRGDIILSRDGPGLQYIRVVASPHDKAFPAIEKSSTAEMLPSELAELELAELKARAGMAGVEMLSSSPATLSGRSGFRLHLRINRLDGLVYERLVYGCATDTGLFRLIFEAPSLHYFARDLPVFEQLVRTFRIVEAIP